MFRAKDFSIFLRMLKLQIVHFLITTIAQTYASVLPHMLSKHLEYDSNHALYIILYTSVKGFEIMMLLGSKVHFYQHPGKTPVSQEGHAR